MGEVFEAEHVLLGSRAAVKVLLPELSLRSESVSRFFNEARTAAAVRHAGLTQVFDFGYHESGSAFIIMELLDGDTLGAILKRRTRLPAAEAVALAHQIAGAMSAAHQLGIVHRDLKPENLYLTPDLDMPGGVRVKVLDFGVAKLTAPGDNGSNTTRTGQLIGTPLYMAPEQCHGASQVDARADIYSLGCIIYHMLCGRPPFVSEGVGPVIAAHLYETAVLPGKMAAGIPRRLQALTMRLLEKSPDDRPQTMEEVEALLANTLERPSEPQELAGEASAATLDIRWDDRRHRRLWGVGACVAAVGAFVVLSALDWRRGASAPVASGLAVATPEVHETPAPPADVTLRIDSRPRNAEVFRLDSGTSLGRTPLVLTVYPGGSVAFRLRKTGFVSERIDLETRKDAQATVVLAREAPSLPRRPLPKTLVKDGALDPFGN